MSEKLKQTSVSSPLSKDLYKRREEVIINILSEIDQGMISKLGACKKYGLDRKHLTSITKLTVRILEVKYLILFLLK